LVLGDPPSPDGNDGGTDTAVDEVSTVSWGLLGSCHSIIIKLIADEIPGLRAMTELRFPAATGGSKVDGEDFGSTPEELTIAEDSSGGGSSCPEEEADSCNDGGGFEDEVTSLLSMILKIAALVSAEIQQLR
jgi:hypothetical protein